MRTERFVAVLGALLVLVSCAGSREEIVKALGEAVDGYNYAYRWKNYQRAVQYLPGDLRGPFLAAYEDDVAALQIEDFQVLNMNVVGSDHAVVTVRLSYLMLPSVSLQKATLVQQWRRLSGHWILESEEGSLKKLTRSAKPKSLGVKPPPKGQDGETELEFAGPGETLDGEDEAEDEDTP